MPAFERAWVLAVLAVVWPSLWWWHRRRARPRARVVSSVTLWRLVAASPAPRRRRRVSADLILAMLTATALVVALAGPARVSARAAPRWLVVVDRSASMANRAPETAYQRAASRLRAMVVEAPIAPTLAVLAVPATGDPESLESLATLIATPAATDRAFDRAVRAAADADATVVAITDRPAPPDLAGRVGWIQVGSATRDNAGIVWLRPEDRPVTVGVLNGGDALARRALVLERAGAVRTLARVDLAPGETWDGSLPPAVRLRGGDRLRLVGEDALALDDVVTVLGAPLGAIDVYADGPVPRPVMAAVEASAGLTAVRHGASDGGPTQAGRAALYWRCSPPGPSPPVAVVFATEGTRFDGLSFGAPVAIARVRRDPAPADGVPVAPSRVVRAHRVSGLGPEWRVRAAGFEADGTEHALILARGGRLVIAFDPIADAPAWVREPGFPALFFEHFDRARGLRASGVLAASESRLAALGADLPPPVRSAAAAEPEARSYALEALAIALLGMIASVLVPVSRAVARSSGAPPRR